MRYKNGAPEKLFVVVDQHTGDVSASPYMRSARIWKCQDEELTGNDQKIVTYVPEKKK